MSNKSQTNSGAKGLKVILERKGRKSLARFVRSFFDVFRNKLHVFKNLSLVPEARAHGDFASGSATVISMEFSLNDIDAEDFDLFLELVHNTAGGEEMIFRIVES